MTDIVKQLRDYSEGPGWGKVCNDAADEIERLRQEADQNQWRKDWHILAAEIERLREHLTIQAEGEIDDARFI